MGAENVGASTVSGAGAGAMFGPWGAAAGAVIGFGIGLFGELSKASDEQELEQRKAQMAEMQARELEARELLNEEQMLRASDITGARVASSLASGGRAGGAVGTLLEIDRQTRVQIEMNRRDTEFKAKMLRLGADANQFVADSYGRAATWNILGMGAQTLGTVSRSGIFKGSTTDLPKVS